MYCPFCNVRLMSKRARMDGAVAKRNRECPDCLTVFRTREHIEYDKLPQYIRDKLHEKIEYEKRSRRWSDT